MKTQMRFQKTLCLVTLIISALAIVYAFAFFTGGLATISDIYNGFTGDSYGVEDLYIYANNVNDVLLILGIVYLLMVVLLYVFACNKRRNYYKDSVVVSIIAAAFIAVYAVVTIALVASVHAMFGKINIEEITQTIELIYEEDNPVAHTGDSPVMFIIGYVFSVIALVNAGAIAYNLIWKIKLMKGEKELLAKGLVKEVA